MNMLKLSRAKLILGTIAIGGTVFYIRNKYEQFTNEQTQQKYLMSNITQGKFNTFYRTQENKTPTAIQYRRNNILIFKMLYSILMERFIDQVVFCSYYTKLNSQKTKNLFTKIKQRIYSFNH